MAPLGRLTWQPSHNFFFLGPESFEELPQKCLVNFLSLLSSRTNPFGCCPRMAGQFSFLSFLATYHSEAARNGPVNLRSLLSSPVPNCLNPKTSVSSFPSAPRSMGGGS